MEKYFSVFKVSLQQDFAYRINFIMWRVRNILQIFVVFFLWDTLFSAPGRRLFGYDRAKIITYVFALILVRAIVLSAKATEVSGEVSRGDLNNYLVKPVNYFKYWFTRDISSKVLNIGFAIVETILLYIILKPPFFFQTNPIYILGFMLSVAVAMLIFFITLFITSSISFWFPELAWGSHFLVTTIIVEFLSGALFPLDVLPLYIQNILNYTPFPYLIFFPVQVYLGKISLYQFSRGLLLSLFWVIVLWVVMNKVWEKGLKAYQAYGR